MSLQRSIDAARCAYRHGDADHIEVITSASYRDATPDATPEVSVIVTLFDYAAVVGETLDSIVASTGVDIEIVIVDDHSNDHGRQVVSDFIEAHPDTPIVLIGVDANRGLPASRNRAIEYARGAKVMVMDADNHIYPTCLRRLADALDAHPGAAFSWSILEEFAKTTGLRSATGWHVPWLCVANHIDAQAMFRAATFEQHGGYRVDDALVFGWEDWEMWLRLAASGERGVHVAEMLGRYRTQETSMLATSNLFGDLMLEHLRQLHPTLPWPTPAGP
jgi:glycosyltransferase involved in cell wall biosynthesis